MRYIGVSQTSKTWKVSEVATRLFLLKIFKRLLMFRCVFRLSKSLFVGL